MRISSSDFSMWNLQWQMRSLFLLTVLWGASPWVTASALNKSHDLHSGRPCSEHFDWWIYSSWLEFTLTLLLFTAYECICMQPCLSNVERMLKLKCWNNLDVMKIQHQMLCHDKNWQIDFYVLGNWFTLHGGNISKPHLERNMTSLLISETSCPISASVLYEIDLIPEIFLIHPM